MATVILTNVPTTIDDAESVSSWGGDTFSLEPDIKIQGGNSISCVQTTNGNNDVYVTGSWNFSIDVHLRLWFNITYISNLSSTNPIQIFLYDGTNTAYYALLDGTSYKGGWKQAVMYTGNTPTSGSVNKSSITRIGIRMVTTTKPRNLTNAFYDFWTYGNGYTITGGTSGDEISWDLIASTDAASAYGMVTKIDDIYFLAGDIKIGNGATTTYFKSGEKVQFKDLSVSSTLYQVLFQGNACNIDINGGAYGAAGTQNFKLDASDVNINSFSFQGVQIEKSGLINFSVGETIKNCVFNNCNQINPSTSTFTNNTFSNYVGTIGALLFPSDDSNLSDINFINCNNGIEYSSTSDPSSPAFSNLTFDDVSGKYDVNNTSGSSATIALSGTSNANSYNSGGSLVTFQSSSTLSMTVIDEVGSVVVGAYAYIDDDNITPFIMNTTTNVSGIASVAWTGGSVTGATWRIRKYGYKAYKAISDVPASGTKDIPVTLIVDPQQTNILPLWSSFEVGNIDTTTLVMTTNTLLNTTNSPATTDFTVSGNTVTTVDMTTNYQVKLTLGTVVIYTDTISIDYTKGTYPIKDNSNNELSALSGQAVINNVATPVSPVWSSFEVGNVDATTLVMVSSKLLDTINPPAVGDFAVSSNTVTTVDMSTAYQVRLTLGTAIVSTDTVTENYVKGTYPIKDTDGLELSALSGQAIVNNVSGAVDYSIGSVTYDSKSYDPVAEIPSGLEHFTIDGGYLYCSTLGDIFKYNMVDDLDVSLCTYTGDTTTGNQARNFLKWSGDGLKLVKANFSNTFLSTTTSVAYSLTNLGSDANTVITETTDTRSWAINNAGTKVYAMDKATSIIYQYSVSPNFGSTLVYDSKSIDISTNMGQGYGMVLSPDDQYLIIVDNGDNTMKQFHFGTTDDITTLAYDSISISIGGQAGTPYAVNYNGDGTKILVLNLGDKVYQYSLNN